MKNDLLVAATLTDEDSFGEHLDELAYNRYRGLLRQRGGMSEALAQYEEMCESLEALGAGKLAADVRKVMGMAQ